MNQVNYSVFNALLDIFAAPGRALEEVKKHTGWLIWPLLINIGLFIGVFFYYYGWVDFDWFVNEQIRALPADAPSEAAQQIREFMSPGRTMAFTAIGIVVVTPLIYLLQAVYLHLANKLTTGAEIGFGQWFSFSTWTAFVGVINALSMLAVILMADSTQVPQHELMPLSMNQLFLHAGIGDPWFNWGNSLTLVNFWMLGLLSIGYQRWTGASLLKSAIIACLPWVLIFGIWALRV